MRVSSFRWTPPPGGGRDPGETRNSGMGCLHLRSPCVHLAGGPPASPGASRLGPHTLRIREPMPSPGHGARLSDWSLPPAHGGLLASHGPPNSTSARIWGAEVPSQGCRELQGSAEEPTTRTRTGGAVAGLSLPNPQRGRAGLHRQPKSAVRGRRQRSCRPAASTAGLRGLPAEGSLRGSGTGGEEWRKRKAGD